MITAVEKIMNRQFTEKSPNDYAVYEMILNPPENQRDANENIKIFCFPWHGYDVRQMKKIIKSKIIIIIIIKSKAGESVGKR